MIKQAKSLIRKEILTLLRNQKEEDRTEKSRLIMRKLFADPEFQCSKTVLFYASFDGEVETFEMMRQSQRLGKQIALPAIRLQEKMIIPYLINNLDEDLEEGPYGIRQPRPDRSVSAVIEEIDLSVVPGVAFDKRNHRLGRGAGYYDRFLASLTRQIPSIGLAFEFQVVASLPPQEHDVPVTRVLTNA